MSKIQVDAIEQNCGTTLTVGGGASKTVVVDATTTTLGRSGGTVSLASGATQSGFGRTGTVDWDTTPKTTTVTAVNGNGYFVNTTAGAITVNLPAGSAGNIISLSDYAATWQTNNVTVTPNGTDKIGSVNDTAVLSTEGQSITLVYVDATQGWINTMDSTSNIRGATPAFVVATVSGAGNTIGTAPDCANYKVATFTGPGTFTVCSVGNPIGSDSVEYMVVAGGGGGAGAGDNATGGAGAGGYRVCSAFPVTASPYPITIGAGGARGVGLGSDGTSGSNSSFTTVSSTGGGRSAGPGSPSPGGSGGGTGDNAKNQTAGTGNAGAYSPPEGNAGGGIVPGACASAGSGGGGAGAVGTDQSNLATPYPTGVGGAGGVGLANSISGSPVFYAGGGGGGAFSGTFGAGGNGGGGTASRAGGPGTINTGGGGSGTGSVGPGNNGGSGGSGIVIIRYKFQ